MYIKNIDTTIDDAIARLDYNLSKNRHADDEESIEYSSNETWNYFRYYDRKSSDTSNKN